MKQPEMKHCIDDPAHLAAAFDAIGFTAYDVPMLARCAELMALAPSVDFQFDIRADGMLGDSFGLSLSFNEIPPQQARECMESGCGAELMNKLQQWGLADDRWKLIAGSAFARHIGFERDDGSEGRFALCVLLNYAKIKFTAADMRSSKFYLMFVAGEL